MRILPVIGITTAITRVKQFLNCISPILRQNNRRAVLRLKDGADNDFE